MTISNLLKSYKRDEGGNMAVVFAAVLFAVLIGAGAALDTGMAQKARKDMQNVADAAALAAAKSGLTAQADLQSYAADYVALNTPAGETLSTALALTNQGRVRVNVTGDYDTQIMSVFGKNKMDLAVVSEAPLANSEPVNLALVLDTTGSMSGTKMAGLKTAAGNLITTLEGYNNTGLKVSVVPFSQYVNVGLSRRNASWLDVPADTSTTGAQVCRMRRDVISRTNCRTEHKTCYNDGVPYSCSRQVCDISYGQPYQHCYTPTTNVTWRGCVGSRTAPWDQRAEFASRRIPGLMNVNCGKEIQPLTANLSSVQSKISSLNAQGNTYIPSGLVWGWRTLEGTAPLTQAASGSFAANTEKVMVVMTDGANTKSKTGDTHNGNNRNAANTVTKDLCNNIKDTDVTIYTIAYDITDAATKNMMRNCASKNSMYFDASNAAQLDQAFQSIAASLIKLRLTH